jgi:hypothetical protein
MSLDINLTGVEKTSNKKTTLTDNSDTFYPTQKAVKTAVDLKVDKIAGKGLSTEDYTTAEKSKLAGIQAGAEVNVNADWNATSGDAQILNKPTIPTQTNQLTNNGADGVNPFITALDIPTAGQAGTLVREVKNMTGATLTKGTVVFISGANGNKPLVSKALAVSDALSSRTFGLLQSNILNNGVGYCVVIGDLSGLDTSAFTEGAQLYLSGTVAGTFTETKTLAPTHLVYVGKVTRSHPTQGQIEVQIQNGYELNEIHDVAISSVANNQTLVYESATTLWKNKALTASDVGAVATNSPITGATKTKITYDAKGLVTAGADATTADIADSTDKRYVTDAQLTVIGNTSNTNTGDQDLSGLLPLTGGALSGQLTFATPVTLASASTVDLMSAGSNIVYISGTTTINSFGTSAETNLIYVKFLGALTLTYNATSMLLPGPGHMTTAANDEAIFLNLGGGNWKCISYTPYSQTGTGATVRASNPTITGNPTIGNSSASSAVNIGTGATSSGNTKTINVGTNGVAGSTTNINIGSALSNTTARVFGSLLANNLSNTNTGDETQSTILSKLGWFKTLVTTNYSVTGTSGETMILPSTQVPTLSNGTIFKINTLRISKGLLSGSTIRAYLSPNSNNLSGALQILSTGSVIVAGTRLATISRVFEIEGGNIKGLNASTGVINDNGTSTVAGLDAALPSGTLYLIVTVTNSLSTETTTQELLDISNF